VAVAGGCVDITGIATKVVFIAVVTATLAETGAVGYILVEVVLVATDSQT
jgi:hypothetical protein